jgi:Flp pilus assembly protein TadG
MRTVAGDWGTGEASMTRQTNQPRQTLTAGHFRLDKLCRLGRRKRRGAAVVEFAIVAPLFFLLVFAMIEYGRMVMVSQIITNASREGARQAVLDGATNSEVTNAVDEFLESSSIQGAEVTTIPSDISTAVYGDAVTVSVSIDFDQVSWIPSPMYLGGQEIKASTVMRRESVQ